MIFKILQSVIIVFFPILAFKIHKLFGKSWLSPVILCYGAGILIANLNLIPTDRVVCDYFSQGTILFAIPLLLYSTDIIGWFKLAKTTIISFVLCVISGLLITVLTAFFLNNGIENIPHLAGMITGIYTGGIPNMNAVGFATNAPAELFVYLNAADVLIGGAYLIFLTSFAPKIYGAILPKFESKNVLSKPQIEPENLLKRENLNEILQAIGLTVLIIGMSVGLTIAFTGELTSVSLLILLLTTFSVIASLNRKVRGLRGSYDLGDYLLLMFCVAIGMMADMSEFAAEGADVTMFLAIIWGGMVILHLVLARLFKIDRDTVMITSTAALYGPPFIGQIANVIQNRQLVFSGIATGLLGYSIGNFLGILMFNLLQFL